MFENLTDRLGSSLKNLAGQGSLTEDNIRDTLREVRKALLEADVALPVVKEFVEQVKEKALGQEVLKSLNPGQAFVKIVNDELVHTMGDANDALNLATKPPAIILMAGLQVPVRPLPWPNSPASCRNGRRRRSWWCPPTCIARRRSSS